MATIGTFTKNADGSFSGEIITLSVQSTDVRILPLTERSSDSAPSHRVVVGRAEIGAAWNKRAGDGREYLGLELDDPSFAVPIYANLFAEPDGMTHVLVWTRQRRAGD
jgi:uncharacterized protein (DUF736 family)